jgi:hypothetical protein
MRVCENPFLSRLVIQYYGFTWRLQPLENARFLAAAAHQAAIG